MVTRKLITVTALILAAVLPLVLSAHSCVIQSEQNGEKKTVVKKLPRGHDGLKLAQDLMDIGFIPLAMFTPSPEAEIYHPTNSKEYLAMYDNGHFLVDEQGRLISILLNPPYSSRYARGVVLKMNTYEGSDLLKLTRADVERLYGIQKDIQAEVDANGAYSVFYVFQTSDYAFINVGIGFDGPGKDAKVSSIQATYSNSPWVGKNKKRFVDWPVAISHIPNFNT